MSNPRDRFENFKCTRAVFVFEHPETKNWIGITMCDNEFLPITDSSIVKLITTYHGDLKCDIRVETRNHKGEVELVRGFEWKQIHDYDAAIRYRLYYSSFNRILSAPQHTWQLASKDRPSIINALYILAARHQIPINDRLDVRLLYKSLKSIVCKAKPLCITPSV